MRTRTSIAILAMLAFISRVDPLAAADGAAMSPNRDADAAVDRFVEERMSEAGTDPTPA